MEQFRDVSVVDVSRFSEDLKLFHASIPRVFQPGRAPRQTDCLSLSVTDTVAEKQLHTDHNTAVMQRQESPRYTPKPVYNQGYTSVEGTSSVASDHKPPIATSGGSPSPGPGGAASVGGGLPPAGKMQTSTGYSPSASSLEMHRAMLNARGMSTHGSPARTVTSSGMMPQSGMVNSQSQGHGGGSNQVVGSVPAPKPGPQLVPKGGSNYSSPRSSIGSYDSKGSSPRTSLINPPPPPPYDFQRHGSPHSSSLASPRSSVSATSLDSKHSSPRASITGSLLYDKFPSPRGSVAGEKYWPHQGNVTGDHHVLNTTSEGQHFMPIQSGMRMHANISLMDPNRYNEPAPPPPYDARMKVVSQVSPQLSPSHGPSAYQNSSPNHVYSRGGQQGNMVPITVIHSNMTTQQQNSLNHQARSNSTPVSMPSQSPSHQPKTNPVTITHKLPGLKYDVTSVKTGPSEAERKLAALTQQLEDDMRISSSPSSTRKGGMEMIPTKPPPPYHGPHNTEPITMTTYNPPNYSAPISDQQSIPSSLSSTPSSSRLNLSSNNVKSPLPYQVTPPPPKGPTEAEKKMEALTAELENQMEKHPQGEYFGQCLFLSRGHCKVFISVCVLTVCLSSKDVYVLCQSLIGFQCFNLS